MSNPTCYDGLLTTHLPALSLSLCPPSREHHARRKHANKSRATKSKRDAKRAPDAHAARSTHGATVQYSLKTSWSRRSCSPAGGKTLPLLGSRSMLEKHTSQGALNRVSLARESAQAGRVHDELQTTSKKKQRVALSASANQASDKPQSAVLYVVQ